MGTLQITGNNTFQSGALSLVGIVEIMCSHSLNFTMYVGAKGYAITTHLKECKMGSMGDIMCLSVC